MFWLRLLPDDEADAASSMCRRLKKQTALISPLKAESCAAARDDESGDDAPLHNLVKDTNVEGAPHSDAELPDPEEPQECADDPLACGSADECAPAASSTSLIS